MSLVSINFVNNIECYWSRSHNLSATHCLPRVLSDLFTGQCHQLPQLLPLGLHLNHLKPLSATLIRFISHLNIKICKLLRVVFSHLKLSIKAVETQLHRQGYILTNLINMSVKFFSTVSIVFFPVDFKSARYHSRFCIFNKLICIFPKWPPKKSNRLSIQFRQS